MTLKNITYCGHSAFLVEFNDKVIGIDPWLEANPLCPENLKNPKKLDYIVLSHGHSDHAGDVLRLAHKYNSKIFAIWELASILISEGIPSQNIVPMNKGGSVLEDGLTITLTHAQHSNSYDSTKLGTLYAGEACGLVLSDGKNAIYHAGDTSLFSDISMIKERYQPKVALIPIGDRFTMGPKEAALAARLVGAEISIPIHYNTFPLLTGTAAEFSQECSKFGLESLALEPGKTFNI
ncbi:MAG: metal-dependent hydrolase [bacterium]|nr:metal-dependent hydrolase [bacterium]